MQSSLAGSKLLGLAFAGTSIVQDARLLGVIAVVAESCNITVSLVDAGELTPLLCNDSFDVDFALALAGAVSAGAVQFSVSLDVEVVDLR